MHTRSVVFWVGITAAATEGYTFLADKLTYLTDLRDYARKKLSELPVELNLPAGACAPHIVNLTLPDIKSETMLHALSAEGIYVSHGSACSSHSRAVSSALTGFGFSIEQIECSIRISFGIQNTRSDVDALTDALSSAIQRLVKIHR